MRHVPALAALLALAACHSEESRERIRDMQANGQLEGSPARAVPATAAKPVTIERDDDLVDFHFAWPAEAAAVPAIDARFRAEADKSLAELVAGAREDKAMREKDGYEFNGYSSSTHWETFGQSPRLLSLGASFETFTGGAHPNHATLPLLWDRTADKELGFGDLFPSKAAGFAAISDAWCKALDAERRKRRGADFQIGDPGDSFNTCPDLDEIRVLPTDGDKDGRFETLDVRADPYVAGPYAEGDYQFSFPVTAALVEALRPDYRASFAAQRQ